MTDPSVPVETLEQRLRTRPREARKQPIYKGSWDEVCRLCDEAADALAVQREALTQLRNYVRHEDDCDTWATRRIGECTCGLSAALAASPEGRAMSKSKRTRKQVEKDLKFAIEQRERFATAARQTDDKDEKQGLYINVDNANARIRKLVEEREAMTPGR